MQQKEGRNVQATTTNEETRTKQCREVRRNAIMYEDVYLN